MIAPIESLGKPGAARHRRSLTSQPPRKPAERATDSGSTPGDFVNRSLARYPTAAVVSSVVVGLTLGWLIKRKWNT